MKLGLFVLAVLCFLASVNLSSQTPPLVELTSADGTAEDTFGTSVAALGNTLVVGAPSATVAGANFRSGAAYVFVNAGSGWNQIAKLVPSDGGDDDFGSAVAIGMNTIAVGAPKKNPHRVGGIYIFVQPPGGWTDMTETARLDASDQLVHTIGSRVAITGDGNTVLATRPLGAVFGFVKPQGGWANTIHADFEMFAPPGVLGFATSVAATKDTVAVSSALSALGQAGAVYVYSLPMNLAGTPKLQPIAILSPSDGVTNDEWDSVAISGNVIVAGAPYHATGGAAYVFVEPPAGWSDMTQTAELSAAGLPAESGFGFSVATSGKNVAVGAPGYVPGGNGVFFGQGAFYLFTQPPGGWADSSTPKVKVVAPDGSTRDVLGNSIAISGSTVVSGAPMHNVHSNKDQGAAYGVSPQ